MRARRRDLQSVVRRNHRQIAAKLNDPLAHASCVTTDFGGQLNYRLVHLGLDAFFQKHFAVCQNLLDVRAQLTRFRIDDLKFLLDSERKNVGVRAHWQTSLVKSGGADKPQDYQERNPHEIGKQRPGHAHRRPSIPSWSEAALHRTRGCSWRAIFAVKMTIGANRSHGPNLTNERSGDSSWFAEHRLGFTTPENIVGGVPIRLSWTYVPQLTAVLAGSLACQAAQIRSRRSASQSATV